VSRTKVFVSYSHVDHEWRDRLMAHLAVLERQGRVDLWADTRIRIGDEWRRDLDDELLTCRIALLVVSANFLSSQFIQEVEVKALLKRHEDDGLLLLPVVARPCAWRLVDWLERRQCRPEGGRALSLGTEPEIDRDLALLTYEIGMLLGEAGSAAVDEMARLSTESLDSTDRVTSPGPSAAAPAVPGLAGQSWRGHYAAVAGGARRSMVLSIETADRAAIHGQIRWPDENAVTALDGRLLTTMSAASDPATWARALASAQQPLCTLRFADSDQRGGRQLQLGGDYRAVLQTDMALFGFWYPSAASSEPIGEFALEP
jgi:hypothetical protein